MKSRIIVPALLVTCGLALSACGTQSEGGTFFVTKMLGDTSALVTSADVRLVISTPVGVGTKAGQIIPRRVVCAEPSPDLAKAVQNSFGLGTSLGVSNPAGVSGQFALSISKARAESAAQLGERLATIQLLRDGLYRACEAYANGAFGAVTYAVLLSRYDDTMVTMLTSELAAGAFGRSLATLSGSADASGTAKGELKSTFDVAVQKEKELAEAETDLQRKKQGEVTDAQKQEVADAQKKVDKLETESKIANETYANAKATAAAVAAGAIMRTQDHKIAKVLHDIQRKYIENINADALIVACITALDRDTRDTKGKPSELSKLCAKEKGILETVVGAHHDLLMAKINRENLRRDTEALGAAIDNIKDIRKSLKDLKSAKEPKAAPAAAKVQKAADTVVRQVSTKKTKKDVVSKFCSDLVKKGANADKDTMIACIEALGGL